MKISTLDTTLKYRGRTIPYRSTRIAHTMQEPLNPNPNPCDPLGPVYDNHNPNPCGPTSVLVVLKYSV